MKIRYVLLLFTAVLLLFTVGCSEDRDEVSDGGNHNYAEEIQDDLEVFSGGDISAITESVFGITSGAVELLRISLRMQMHRLPLLMSRP